MNSSVTKLAAAVEQCQVKSRKDILSLIYFGGRKTRQGNVFLFGFLFELFKSTINTTIFPLFDLKGEAIFSPYTACLLVKGPKPY